MQHLQEPQRSNISSGYQRHPQVRLRNRLTERNIRNPLSFERHISYLQAVTWFCILVLCTVTERYMEGTPLAGLATLFRSPSSSSRLASRTWAVFNVCIRLNQANKYARGYYQPYLPACNHPSSWVAQLWCSILLTSLGA
ncbi:hypothetical protein RU639_004937 [Aspergillus parasiticus]